MLRRHLSRYAATTAIATILNIAVFYVLSETLALWYIAASILAFLARSIFRYGMFRSWVFEARTNAPRSLVRFLGLESLSLIAGTGMLYALVEFADLPKLGALVLVMMTLYALTFVTTRRLFLGS